ncbi:MAG: exodeoxyribonuclease III [Methanobacterium sp.]|nr:exodeoxyribonuclease III [Methanobacterium sp.]
MFILYNIYFPSAQGTKEGLEHKFKFYEDFLEEMRELKDEKVIICGDFNIAHNEIDLVNPVNAAKNAGFLPEERAFLNKLMDFGYIDTFRMFNGDHENFTWWAYGHNCREKNIGMRLDHFFVCKSLKDNIGSAYVLSDVMGSDHCPIGVRLY